MGSFTIYYMIFMRYYFAFRLYLKIISNFRITLKIKNEKLRIHLSTLRVPSANAFIFMNIPLTKFSILVTFNTIFKVPVISMSRNQFQ